MSEVTRPAQTGKWETIRRLRYGDVLKLIRHRYGANGVPDDDAGRPDLMELLFLASMAPTGAEKKVRNNIELYAPWMQADEVEALIQHFAVTPHYEKLRTAEALGSAVLLKNVERERLKLWRLKPYDISNADLEAQAKDRERNRRASQRRKQGVRPKAEYLAELASRPKPWVDAGVSQRTWQRRLCRDASQEMSRCESETIVSKQRSQVATTERGESQGRGQQERGEVKMQREAREVEQAESQEQGGSSDLRSHPATSPADELAQARAAREAINLEAWKRRHEKRLA